MRLFHRYNISRKIFLLYRLCLLKVWWRPAPYHSLFSSALKAPHPLCYMSFSVPCLLFIFFSRAWVSLSRGLCWFIPGFGCGSSECHLFAHLLVCVFQTGLEPVSGSMGTLLVSQCNVAWRSFVQPGGLGCQSFASSW
jgi:hypothetical protein